MSMTQIELINAALIKLGAYKITALNDGSTEADMASTLYAPVRDAVLSLHPWNFATKTISVTTLSVTLPTTDYTYAYDLPVDHLRTLSVGSNDKSMGETYRHIGNRLETNANPITLTYIARVDETFQPPFFNMALINRLAAEMCTPLTENAARAENFYKIFDRDLAQARTIDAMQETPRSIENFNLIQARG